VELLPHVLDTLNTLRGQYRLILITKGDLLDQERKLAGSGLRGLFDVVEIVSDKSVSTYARIFDTAAQGAARGLMVGNSMKSDVRPMIEAGGWGVYVPHGIVWELEHAEPPESADRYAEIRDLGALPALIDRINAGPGQAAR